MCVHLCVSACMYCECMLWSEYMHTTKELTWTVKCILILSFRFLQISGTEHTIRLCISEQLSSLARCESLLTVKF